MNHFLRAAALGIALGSVAAPAADEAPPPAPFLSTTRSLDRSAQVPPAAPAAAPSPSAVEPGADDVQAAAPVQVGTARQAAARTGSDDLTDDPFAAPDPDGNPDPESMLGTLWKMFLSLGIVIGLVYVTLNYGLRKLMGARGAMLGRAALVKVVERVPLDPKRTLFVIEAAGEYLLVGGADQNLTLISKLPPDEVQKLLSQRQPTASKPSPFLQKLLARSTPSPSSAQNEPPARSTEDP
ncbi:MAG: flagellar biosynthetic protein FliO [Myxococcaceae bacterium]|nr:flagellar biosynthetic protein FliO [Myxococcaceae bacterium]